MTRPLKSVYTIVNCQRPVFSLGVSQHMHKITCENLSSIGRRSCEITMKEKHPYHTKLCAFRCLIAIPQILNLRSRNQIGEKLLLSRKLQHFSYQVRFYANNYFELLPIVSTAFKKVSREQVVSQKGPNSLSCLSTRIS